MSSWRISEASWVDTILCRIWPIVILIIANVYRSPPCTSYCAGHLLYMNSFSQNINTSQAAGLPALRNYIIASSWCGKIKWYFTMLILMEWRKLTSRQETGCLKYFSSNLMRVWKGRVSTERLQLCVRLSSLLPLVPVYFLSLHVALQSNNKPCQDSEAGMGPWKYSHYCTSQFQMGCIGDQTLWWNRILVGASLMGSVNHYKVIPQAVALEQSLEMTFCWLGTFPERVHLRVSRCCSAQIGCGQHLGGLKHAGFSPNWTHRFLPTLDAWLRMAGHPQQSPAPRVDVLV